MHHLDVEVEKGQPCEWTDFRMRSFRQARQVVLKRLRSRWSTQWLARWWGFMGHTARGSENQYPPCSCQILHSCDHEWWQQQQQGVDGARHAGRFYAKLSDLDQGMNQVVGGP